jgi:hypothetical protein
MAAGLGFKTFTTGEVLTAADTNGYLMQGVNVFADAAARTAAITSPQEGQMSYLKDTNATEYYSGSAWTSLAPAASGGMTLISTTTLSGASVTLSSIPQTYVNLYLRIENFKPASDGGYLIGRMNADSGANRHYQMRLDGDVTGDTEKAFDATSYRLTGYSDSSVATGLTTAEIDGYTNTTTWKFAKVQCINTSYATTTSFIPMNSFGVYNQTSAISSLYIASSSGNMTSGTVYLYGVK